MYIIIHDKIKTELEIVKVNSPLPDFMHNYCMNCGAEGRDLDFYKVLSRNNMLPEKRLFEISDGVITLFKTIYTPSASVFVNEDTEEEETIYTFIEASEFLETISVEKL